MEDGNYIDSDEDQEVQINLEDEQCEEEDIVHPVNPNSVIHEAIKNIKRELAANHISGKNNNISDQMKKFPLISLDKLASFLLKFVKQANLSLYNRRILFAAITPIHHIFLHVVNGSNFKGASAQPDQTSLYSPPYEPNSLKKCVDYFINVFNLIQYDSQQINENFFIHQFEKIIDQVQHNDENYFNQIRPEIEGSVQFLLRNFKKIHESQSINSISNKQIQKCKVELKRFKIMILPLFEPNSDTNPLKNDFLSYYNNFYSELKNFELFYKVNMVISQFKENWDQPLFWFLPCQMSQVDSDTVFNSAMEYLQTFWMTGDLNFINIESTPKSDTAEKSNDDTSNQNEKKEDEINDAEKSDTDTEKSDNEKGENNSSDIDTITDPEEVRIKMFDVLELLSFQNRLEPENCSVIAGSFMRTVNKYNTLFVLRSTLSPTNFDIEDIKSIISVVSVLPYTLKDVVCYFNRFLSERVKLLKHYMHVYNDTCNRRINKKSGKCCMTISSVISNHSTSSSSSVSSFDQKILCNATFNEIFTYFHSFVLFANKAKETPLLYPMIKDEIYRLIGFYSELLLKAQMLNDSRTLAKEALRKAKEFSLENERSMEMSKEETRKKLIEVKKNRANFHLNDNDIEDLVNSINLDSNGNETSVDLFRALRELVYSTRRVLQTNFIKDEKKDFMERFYTYLKICCPYIQNLRDQQIQKEGTLNMSKIKHFLSEAFPLFDTLDIFRFETTNLDEPQISSSDTSKEVEKVADEVNDDLCYDIDLKSVWSTENKELLFNKSFPFIREQARKMQIGVSDDWRSVFEFKSIYKTFCRLFIVRKPELQLNESPTDFERDIHKFFSVATNFFMDEKFNIRESSIPLSTIIDSIRSLSIKWMFSDTKSLTKEDEEGKKEEETTEINESVRQHWDYSSLLFGIAFISVPHPFQTISVFLKMLMYHSKSNETEGRQLTTFSDIFTNTIENFNCDTIDNFCNNPTVRNCLSLFENDIDFFFVSEHPSKNQNTMLFSSIRKQNIIEIIKEIMEMKEKYSHLSSIMTMVNTEYFDKPDSYSRLFVEIAFFANILKSFKDTLVLLKKFDFLSVPSSDPDLKGSYISIFNSTWPFSPGFLDLDMYKNDFPNFLTSLHKSILRLSFLKPNFSNIRRSFDFYMTLSLSTYSFCFSSFFQFPFKNNCSSSDQLNHFLNRNDNNEDGFNWNRNNYGPSVKKRMNSESDIFDDISNFKNRQKENSKENEIDHKFDQQDIIDEIKHHFHALAVLYSNRCSDHPNVLLCCEILSRSTHLIKLLEASGLSDFKILSTILSGLSEVSFSIVCAMNIKKEVERIINSTIYFASLFGIKLNKQPSTPTILSPVTNASVNKSLSPVVTKKTIIPTSPARHLVQLSPLPSQQNAQIATQHSYQMMPNSFQLLNHPTQAQASPNQLHVQSYVNNSPSVQIIQHPQQVQVSHYASQPSQLQVQVSKATSVTPPSSPHRQRSQKKAKTGRRRSRSKSRKKSSSETDQISTLANFTSLTTSFERAAPVFERMNEMMPSEIPEAQHFYRARSLFNSIHDSLDKIKVPTTSEQFASLIHESNVRMENLEYSCMIHQKRINTKRDYCWIKHKKTQAMIESDYSSVTQKIEEETIKSEQLDEDLTNLKAQLKRCKKVTPSSRQTKRKVADNEKSGNSNSSNSNLNANSNEDVLNFNFNFNSPLKAKNLKQKPIAKAQLILAQAQELQRQNNLIQMQIQKNEVEISILNSLNNEKNRSEADNFLENESSINEVIESIMENATDVFIPSRSNGPQFDIDDDEKPSNVLSKSSIFAIVSDIKKSEEQQQNITTTDHSELCDRVEMLAYGLINGTKMKESEMTKLQSQLKNIKNSQKEKLLKLRNVLREIDIDEE